MHKTCRHVSTGARFLSVNPTTEHGADVLMQYLYHYLSFLQDVGNHILYSPPHFGISRPPLLIDFTASWQPALAGGCCPELYGIHVEQINEQLKLAWTKAAISTTIGVSSQASAANRKRTPSESKK